MYKLIQYYRETDRQTKMFWLQVIFYTLAIIGSTIYPYARLNYARSYAKQQTTPSQNKT